MRAAQLDSLFQVSHTDPWVGGDAFRTSRTCSLMNTRNSGNAIHGKVRRGGAQACGVLGCALGA